MKSLLTTVLLSHLVFLTACTGGGSNDKSDKIARESAKTSSKTTTSSHSTTGSTSKTAPMFPEDSNSNTDTKSTKSILLSWNLPNKREDGSSLPISDIGGYEIYYFEENSSPGSGIVIDIPDNQTTEYKVNGLTSGTYYFAIASYDMDHAYSDLTRPVQITIP